MDLNALKALAHKPIECCLTSLHTVQGATQVMNNLMDRGAQHMMRMGLIPPQRRGNPLVDAIYDGVRK